MGRLSLVNLRFIRVYLPALLLLGFLAIGAVEVWIVRQLDRDLVELAVDKARRATEMAHHSIATHHRRWERGDYSLHQARSLVFEDIQSMQFGEDGHFFVVNLGGIAFVDSGDAERVGRRLERDVGDGVRFDFEELLAQTYEKGEGHVFNTYSGDATIAPKPTDLHSVVYAKRFAPWSIVVGTHMGGVEIRSAHERVVKEELALYALIVLVMAPTFLYLRRAATKLIGELESNNAQLLEREAELSNSLAFFKTVTESAPDPIVLVSREGTIRFCSRAVSTVFEQSPDALTGTPFNSLFDQPVSLEELMAEENGREVKGIRGERSIPLRLAVTDVALAGGERVYTAIMQDLSHAKRLEAELNQVHKLESVGQLAAGIAHEINTPAQFVGDNLQFVDESVGDLLAATESIKFRVAKTEDTALRDDVLAALDAADIDFVMAELPRALSESLSGIKRVSDIVQAMKHYAHPGESMQRVDINVNVEKTIAVSRSEWGFHAELVTDFGSEMPLIECIPSDVNQAVLNIIVNAGQAIAARQLVEPGHRGRICVSTRTLSDHVHIVVEDNGIGMEDDVLQRAFDPFFSTREEGQGSGQGLSTALKIVTAHGGTVGVDSEPGVSTLFTIRLPALAIYSRATKAAA